MKTIARRLWARKRLIVILIVIVVGAFLFFRNRNGNGATDKATVERGTVEEIITLTGEIDATDYATLQFNLSGTTSWVGVKVGDEVKKGQALMKLDTTRLNASYQIARSNLRSAEASLNKVYDSLKGKDKTETFAEIETRVAAEVAKDKAYEAFVSAQKDLKDATLIAPFDGFIAILNTQSSGVNITAGTPQVVVVNPNTIYFEVLADQTEIPRFKVGDQAKIVLDAFDEEELMATIASISPAPDTADSGTVYPVRLVFSALSSLKYKVGMTGDANFIVSRKDNTLFVPSNFVNSDKEGDYVLVNEGKDKKYITVGIEGGDRTEISGDINEGEKVFD